MPSWNEPSATYYRELERQQRELAATVSSTATQEIHLEFAERYRKQAEQLEAERGRAENNPMPSR